MRGGGVVKKRNSRTWIHIILSEAQTNFSWKKPAATTTTRILACFYWATSHSVFERLHAQMYISFDKKMLDVYVEIFYRYLKLDNKVPRLTFCLLRGDPSANTL